MLNCKSFFVALGRCCTAFTLKYIPGTYNSTWCINRSFFSKLAIKKKKATTDIVFALPGTLGCRIRTISRESNHTPPLGCRVSTDKPMPLQPSVRETERRQNSERLINRTPSKPNVVMSRTLSKPNAVKTELSNPKAVKNRTPSKPNVVITEGCQNPNAVRTDGQNQTPSKLNVVKTERRHNPNALKIERPKTTNIVKTESCQNQTP